MHAGYWMGAVPVPVNIRLAAPEIAYIVDNAGAGVVVAVDAPFLGLLEHEALAPWRDRAIRVAGPDDGAGAADAGWPEHDYETLIAAADPARTARSARRDDPAILFYTGGTTGRSKGVPLSHRNAVSNGMQVGHTVGVYSDDVYLHVAPMFHSADLLGTGFTLMGSGPRLPARLHPGGPAGRDPGPGRDLDHAGADHDHHDAAAGRPDAIRSLEPAGVPLRQVRRWRRNGSSGH